MKYLSIFICCIFCAFNALGQDIKKNANTTSLDSVSNSIYLDAPAISKDSPMLDDYKETPPKARQIQQNETIIILNDSLILTVEQLSKIDPKKIIHSRSVEDYSAKGNVKKVIFITTKD